MLERVGDKLVETQFVFFEEVDQVTEEETITIKEEPVNEKAETGKKDQAPDQKAETTDEPAPILVSPGFDSITIASDDLEALNQLETLLRNMAPRRNKSGTDFIIFQLKNSLAEKGFKVDNFAVSVGDNNRSNFNFTQGHKEFNESYTGKIAQESDLNASKIIPEFIDENYYQNNYNSLQGYINFVV